MIIFYRITDGKIVGTIDGRIHTPEQLNMWVGSREENDRIVVEWIPVKWFDRDGNELDEKYKATAYTADFKPDHPQDDLMFQFELDRQLLKEYKVDPATKAFVKI